MKFLKSVITGPRFTFVIRFILDECIPPIIRDQKWFFVPILKLYNSKLDPDFKVKAPLMTSDEFYRAYGLLMPMRQTDVTPDVAKFVLEHVVGDSVLEIGCGNGDISLSCAERGFIVTATDLVDSNLERLQRRALGRGLKLNTKAVDVEKIPFDDNSFGTVVCLHTLEHVKNLPRAVSELMRVTTRRLVIVVPRERYYRYTGNYHLNFFGGVEQLTLLLCVAPSASRVIDGAICFAADKSSLVMR
jgi:SAM-dependent methyltransferase